MTQIQNRLKRFVEPGVLPPGVVADFDPEKNLLRIDKAFYDAASPKLQTQMWRAERTLAIQVRGSAN